MAALLQALSGNPFLTPIGHKIEIATDPTLPGEDWALFMEICDLINDTDEGPKDAARAIKRRLQQSAGKNDQVIMYTLTLLESCVKNCGRRFHILVTSKDFVQELVKLINHKNDPTPAVQEKVLNFIQSWSEAFRLQPECSGVTQVYNDLKSKGVEFPLMNLDSMAPIHTPQRTVPPSAVSRKYSTENSLQQQLTTTVSSSGVNNYPSSLPPSYTTMAATRPTQPVLSAPINLNDEQLEKLRAELDVVQGNMNVLHDMLNEMVPGKENEEDWVLLRDLNSTCRAMQSRIVELIEKVANEEITIELLRINDEMNALFERYDVYQVKRNAGQGKIDNIQQSNLLIQPEIRPTVNDFTTRGAVGGASATAFNEGSLIDLSGDEVTIAPDVITSQMLGLSIDGKKPAATSVSLNNDICASGGGGDADFDVFAQSRSGNIEKSSSTRKEINYIDNLSVDQIKVELDQKPVTTGTQPKPAIDSERDFGEMEKWLLEQTNAETAAAARNEPVSKFDQFLASRAEAADTSGNASGMRTNETKVKDPFGL